MEASKCVFYAKKSPQTFAQTFAILEVSSGYAAGYRLHVTGYSETRKCIIKN